MAIHKPPVALIAGPTASGKSSLALALAERTGGVVVNADSAQIYRDLRIINAAPSNEDRARADHRLYGFLDGAEACSAASWAERAKTEIRMIHDEGRLPILTGGTGLYIRTLLNGIAPIPPIDPAIRQDVRARPVDENYRLLLRHDPIAAAILRPTDKTRIARALEIAVSTGRPIADWQRNCEGGIRDAVDLRPLILLPPRDWLYARCDERFARMMDSGAVAEVERLLARRLNPSLPIMRAIGVREIADYIEGRSSLPEAIDSARQATRRYAKRQYTWFRHQPPVEWPRFLKPYDEGGALELLNGTA